MQQEANIVIALNYDLERERHYFYMRTVRSIRSINKESLHYLAFKLSEGHESGKPNKYPLNSAENNILEYDNDDNIGW